MATIRTAIQIQDQLSRPVRAMHNSISMMVNQMEAMNAASGHMMDTSSIEIARRELARAADQFNRIESEVRNADNAQQGFNNHIRDGTSAAEGLASKIKTIVGAYLSIQGLRKGADIISGWLGSADVINTATSQLNNVMRNAGAARAEIESVIDKAGQIEGLSTFGQETLVAGAGELATYLESGKAIEKMLGTLADYAAGMGGINADARQMTEYATQLGKALDGQYDGLRKKGFDVSEAQKKIIENGTEMERVAVISDIIAQSWDGLAQALANTPQGQLAQMANNFDGIKQSLGNMVYPAVVKLFSTINSNMPIIETLMTGFAHAASFVMEALSGIINLASWVASIFIDNWSFIGPILLGIGGAILAYAAYLSIVRVATMLATAAQWAWNAAMTANPIGLVIAGIVLLIGLFYLTINTINHFAGTSINATAIVAGAFMVLGAIIYNVIAYVWNMWASYIEFFVNISKDKTYAVKRLFYNLATNVLDYAIAMTSGWDQFATNFVNAIIDAVNRAIEAWNWFLSLLPDGLTTKLGWEQKGTYDHRESITSDLQGIKAGLKDWLGEAPADYWEVPKMEMKSLGAAYDTGYNWGANLFNSDKNKGIDDAINNALNAGGIGDKLDKANRNGGNTAANTKKTADGIKMLNEDLKYLRDIAERESIDRYTIAEINIDARSENHINKEMDLDGIIDRFTEKVEEAAEVLAEGSRTGFI